MVDYVYSSADESKHANQIGFDMYLSFERQDVFFLLMLTLPK